MAQAGHSSSGQGDSRQDVLKWSQVAFILAVIAQLSGSVWLVADMASRLKTVEAFQAEHRIDVRDRDERIRALENSVLQYRFEIARLREEVAENGN